MLKCPAREPYLPFKNGTNSWRWGASHDGFNDGRYLFMLSDVRRYCQIPHSTTTSATSKRRARRMCLSAIIRARVSSLRGMRKTVTWEALMLASSMVMCKRMIANHSLTAGQPPVALFVGTRNTRAVNMPIPVHRGKTDPGRGPVVCLTVVSGCTARMARSGS